MFLQSVISKYKLAITTVLFFAFFASSYFLYLYSKSTPDLSDYSKSFIRSIEKKESSAKSYLNRIGNSFKNSTGDLSCVSLSEYSTKYDDEGLAFFVYDHDSLISWSTNAVAFDTSLIDSIHKKSLIHLKNGWFDILHDSIGKTKLVCLILVKQDYRYQNEYLVNSFPDEFSLPDNVMISSQRGNHDILSHGNFLCSLSIKEGRAVETYLPVLILLLFVCGLFFLIYLIISLFGKLSAVLKPAVITIITICTLVLFRILFFHYSLPGYIYSLDLFGPKYYAASEILPSLGDLLLNTISLFCIALFIFKKTVVIPALSKMHSVIKWIVAFSSISLSIILFYYTETSTLR